ncbi:ribonuclease R [Patescibacteria group bacterium]|nr:ribonuclease R [Patescibacteria group bacterium]
MKKNKTYEKKHKKSQDKEQEFYEGNIIVTTRKRGFLKTEHGDFEISDFDLNTALNGDIVKIKVAKRGNHASRQAGTKIAKVTEILNRVKTKFVGTLGKDNEGYFLVADDIKFYPRLDLDLSDGEIPSHDVKIVAEMSEWNDPKKNPQGKIIKVIGHKGDNETEMQAILYEKGFEPDFPEGVEAEAEVISKQALKDFAQEIPKRKDMRDRITFTIDPDDAKDFDDALSFKELENGDYEIGVHIADVTHYVPIDSPIDREATVRCTSVYLIDRTIPMLPEVLSNNLCSLNPNEDKLTYSAVFIIDKNAQVKARWFGETIIHSDKRFTYKNAQETLDNKAGEFYKELNTLNELALILRADRTEKGSISFGSNEYKFILDKTGKAIDVYEKQMMDTNELIEDFMLLANREVAQYISHQEEKLKIQLPFVYRIHDVPKTEQLKELSEFLKTIGFNLKIKDNKVSSKELNDLLMKIEGLPEEDLIATAMLKSMAKAIYSTQNIGHFGLGFKHYTHFTSPIRRYPDMMVHRLMKNYLAGKNLSPRSIKKYKELTSKSTQQEIAAVTAERASTKYKFTELMSSKIGQEFEGIISGITKWGVYVQAENGAEGMISVRSLQDDYYELDTKHYRLVGQKTRVKHTLGDKVRVKLVKTDLDKQVIDFELISE